MSGTAIALFKTNYLGDAVTFLPVVAGIRAAYPDRRIVVVCSRGTADLYRGCFPAATLVTVDRNKVNGWRGLLQLPRMILGLRRAGCKTALLSHDEPSLSFLAAWLGGTTRRIGFGFLHRRLLALLTDRLSVTVGRPIVQIDFDLVRCLTDDSHCQPARTAIAFSATDEQRLRAQLASLDIDPDRPFILLHPFAKRAYQQWGLDRYQALAQRFEQAGLPVVLLSEADSVILPPARTIRGLSLAQLAALARLATLHVGNNSGPLHLAAAMGTATLAIQGPTSVEWQIPWQPADRHRHLLRADLPCVPCDRLGQAAGVCTNHAAPMICMSGLSVDVVAEAAFSLLRAVAPSIDSEARRG